MLPGGGGLSSKSMSARFAGASGLAVTKTLAYEDGGIAIQDPSKGLLYQRWRARLINDDIWIDAPNTPEFIGLTVPGMTEMSFTFDQNMRLAIAYVQDGVSKLWWFDSASGDMTTTTIGSGIITPRLTLDDRRVAATGGNRTNDIILGYVRNQKLCYRQQRDRFTIEYVLATGITTGLIKIGLGRQLRLQFMLEVPR